MTTECEVVPRFMFLLTAVQKLATTVMQCCLDKTSRQNTFPVLLVCAVKKLIVQSSRVKTDRRVLQTVLRQDVGDLSKDVHGTVEASHLS